MANRFRASKFCLVIRGDNPPSRSFYQEIRAGCVPVVIRDTLSVYQPNYDSLLSYEDYCTLVSEADFLRDPVGSVNAVVQRLLANPVELALKLQGLALMQRIMVLIGSARLIVCRCFFSSSGPRTEANQNVRLRVGLGLGSFQRTRKMLQNTGGQ